MGRLYRFINLTREMELADRGKVATSPWLRIKGLLGTTKLPKGEGLLIRPCQRIHTFLMAYPIDVLFVDQNLEVAHLYESLAPFRVSRRVSRARFVIELPAGTIERTGTRVGDLLMIESPK